MQISSILIIYLLSISVVAFYLFARDKKLASRQQWRIPESRLLLVSLFGGSVGSVLAMLMFRHKTSKPSFLLKFVFVVIAQVALVFWLWK